MVELGIFKGLGSFVFTLAGFKEKSMRFFGEVFVVMVYTTYPKK